jgi:DNA-binding MarR family transcriptional regulator
MPSTSPSDTTANPPPPGAPPTGAPASGIVRPAVPATAEEAVMTATIRVGRRLRQRLPGDDVEFTALALLKMVAHAGPLRLTALAASLDLDTSTVSRQVRALEDRGLIERTTDPDDGRASRLAVTEAGRRSLFEGAQRRRELIGEIIADWSAEDRESLRLLLHRLADAFTPQENHQS